MMRMQKNEKFMLGDRVLALLPIPGKPLQPRYYGIDTVDKKISDVNYIVNTPGSASKNSFVMLTCLNNT